MPVNPNKSVHCLNCDAHILKISFSRSKCKKNNHTVVNCPQTNCIYCEKRFKCTKCENWRTSYATQELLGRHMKFAHQEETQNSNHDNVEPGNQKR
jgi:hypothetical protein